MIMFTDILPEGFSITKIFRLFFMPILYNIAISPHRKMAIKFLGKEGTIMGNCKVMRLPTRKAETGKTTNTVQLRDRACKRRKKGSSGGR